MRYGKSLAECVSLWQSVGVSASVWYSVAVSCILRHSVYGILWQSVAVCDSRWQSVAYCGSFKFYKLIIIISLRAAGVKANRSLSTILCYLL